MTAPHLGLGHVVAGRYTIRALLGFTGEVATYSATGPSGEEVRIKLYDPALGQRADVMAQLERVRAQVAQLPAHYVVPVIDSGYDTGTGAPFSATEYLQVPSLAKLAENGPLSPDVVATIIRGIAQVLDAAQALQVTHQALKPENIFVGPAPHFPVRITDFGASVVRQTSPTHEAYARSAPWWAPEQLQPAAVLGPATDAFAAALVAFFALTGRSYWLSCQTSPPDLPAWQLEVMGQRLPASTRAAELGGHLDGRFDALFARALSVSQQERPAIAELANALAMGGTPAAAAGQAQQAPAPAAAYGAAAQDPAAAYGAAAQDPAAAYGATPAPTPGGYVATGGQAEPAVAQAGQPPDVTPGLPPFRAAAKKKKSGAMVPVIVGVVVAVLLGGTGVFFLFMYTPASSGSNSSATGSASASSEVSAGVAGDAAGSASTADPAASAASSGDAGVADGDAADAGAVEVDVTIKCIPECDKVFIDNEEIEKPTESFKLIPGKHTVRLIKTGYMSGRYTIEVDPTKPFEKEYRLVKPGKAPAKKPCGQFLKPCR